MTGTPEQSSAGSLFAGLLVGALVGAAVSLLYAPKAGKETREELMGRLDALTEKVDATARSMVEATKTKLAETKADLGQAVEAGRTAAKARADELRHQVGLG
ncbi:MAG TPA: YtxH domain-containing protein [Armatimonadota bacterium]|jgi:gas vesicle protein